MIDTVFQNDDFIVLNKPHNVNFHSEDSKAGFVVEAENELGFKLYSVHRLDKVTSGLIIFAKTSQIAAKFTDMFGKKEIEKYYIAISLRKPKKKQGWIKADMAPSRRGSYKLLKTKNNPAVTQFISKSIKANERLFLIKPHTGKTHQIRVALKSISAPIAGDTRYADASKAKKEQRCYLHAYALKFTFDGNKFEFLKYPEYGDRFNSPEIYKLLETIQKPWELF